MSNLRRFLVASTLALALAAAGGCRPADSDPERAFRHFVERVQARDARGAWALIAPESREALAAWVAARSAESGGAIPDDPAAAILGDAQLARPIESIEVTRRDERTATLEVRAGGEVDRVEMVRTDEGWRVRIELPEEARGASPGDGGR